MWHDRSTDNVKKGVGRGVWQVHLYGEAARCSLRDLFELLGKGSRQVHLYGEAARCSLRDLFELLEKGSRQVHLNGGATNCVDVVGVGWELHM